MVISEDAEVALALSMFGEKLRTKGKDTLAFKIENIIELVRDEVEAELKPKGRKQPQYVAMSVVITEEVTLADIDETIKHVHEMLTIDKYGNRMDWRKKETLLMSLDDLLDARINLVKTGRPFPEESETNEI